MIFHGMLTHSGASLQARYGEPHIDAPYGPYERSLRVAIHYPFHKLNYISARLSYNQPFEKNLQMMRSTGGELFDMMMRWSIVMGAQLCCWINPFHCVW